MQILQTQHKCTKNMHPIDIVNFWLLVVQVFLLCVPCEAVSALAGWTIERLFLQMLCELQFIGAVDACQTDLCHHLSACQALPLNCVDGYCAIGLLLLLSTRCQVRPEATPMLTLCIDKMSSCNLWWCQANRATWWSMRRWSSCPSANGMTVAVVVVNELSGKILIEFSLHLSGRAVHAPLIS